MQHEIMTMVWAGDRAGDEYQDYCREKELRMWKKKVVQVIGTSSIKGE